VVSVSELGLTADEVAQVVRACDWVRMTAGFLPFLRPFLLVRLAPNSRFTRKLLRFNARQIFRLWEIIKEEQLFPSAVVDASAAGANASSRVWEQSQR
jgi:hypothetical protein